MESSVTKILCLHGYRQSGKSFRARTGQFRKLFKNKVDFVFMDAPHTVPLLADEKANEEPVLGWWFSREDDYFRAKDDTECDKGFQESVREIENVLIEKGPFDGVLGFSQGASLLAMLVFMMENGELRKDASFGFVILVSGFKSRTLSHKRFYTTKLSTPSLHVYGETDQIIEREMSEELLPSFENPCILTHGGGHFIPADSKLKASYLKFLSERKV